MIISPSRESSYKQFLRIYRIFYWIFSLAMIFVYALRRDSYHTWISVGTLAIPAALYAVQRIFHPAHFYPTELLILLFSTLSYQLGACLDLYQRIPGFDKLAHFLSGTFVTILCAGLYCLLTPDHKISRSDLPIALLFVFFGSMAVAGLWEIGEYLLSKITLRDMQNVASTGVADSMRDMIVCLLGTLLCLPSIYHLASEKPSLIADFIAPFSFSRGS